MQEPDLLHLFVEPIVWLAPPEYVILRKLQYFKEAGSTKHVRDIRSMLAIQPPDLDTEAIGSFAERLGLAEIWQTISDSVGR